MVDAVDVETLSDSRVWAIAEALSRSLSEVDRQEAEEVSGKDALSALRESLKWSDKAYFIVTDDGTVVGVYGVAPGPAPGYGTPWMLGTDDLRTESVSFLRQTRRVVQEFLEVYPTLYNWVSADNTRAIRWLSWAGFEFLYEEPFGTANRPYIKFMKVR